MYRLHNEPIKVGDIVFDVSATRGIGRVVNLTRKGIEVQFGNGGPRIMYKDDGAQLGKSRATLFWRDPVILIPVKSESLWEHQKAVAIAIRDALMGVRK